MADSESSSAESTHAMQKATSLSDLDVPAAISPSSSSSSFVPIDSVQHAIQLIDENKVFNTDVLDYITRAGGTPASPKLAADHRIISVFGSQSTGKSTLLNALFNTKFGVMDEVNRQQTTKGIWLALSPGVNNCVQEDRHVSHDHVLVMDVEGTDGRERGEDQDFERKAALFAMATSEVLIVNLWETQVGLYQGANMGLLKTVFEVNLSLFGAAKLHKNGPEHKVLLLFVIRDHLGVTPKESLAATITQDLSKIWENLNKPCELANLAFADFFDLAFHTLSHKVLQHDKFLHDVKLLGNRLVDPTDREFLFKPYYHPDIPIEGWTMYAENCWDQIDSNKDLDLPTQQILVAKFKCDEIVNACYDDFLTEFEKVRSEASTTADDSPDFKRIGSELSALKESSLASFDYSAARYNQSVYEQRRSALNEKVNSKLTEVLSIYSKKLLSTSLKQFTADLGKRPRKGPFTETVSALVDALRLSFVETLAILSLNGQLSTTEYAESLEAEVAKIIAKQQIVELNAIINKHVKKLTSGLKISLSTEIANPSEKTWGRVLDKFNAIYELTLDKLGNENGVVDFGVGADEKLNKLALRALEFQSWDAFHNAIHSYISKDNLLNILKERFDDKFRYDQNGLPRLYQNAKELEVNFAEAKTYAMKVFPVLTVARLANGAEITPKINVHDKNLRRKYGIVRAELSDQEYDEKSDEPSSDSESEEEERRCFAEILSESEKTEIMSKFKREIDAKFVETKRSIIQHVTKIPYYIYLVILVLGWNEFMSVLRNPFFFTLLLVLGGALYVMYQTNLLGPALLVAQRMVDEAVLVGKQKLREFVVDDHVTHSNNLKKMSEGEGSIKIEDLEPRSEAEE